MTNISLQSVRQVDFNALGIPTGRSPHGAMMIPNVWLPQDVTGEQACRNLHEALTARGLQHDFHGALVDTYSDGRVGLRPSLSLQDEASADLGYEILNGLYVTIKRADLGL